MKSNRPSDEVINAVLETELHPARQIVVMEKLRDRGYTFDTQWFIDQWHRLHGTTRRKQGKKAKAPVIPGLEHIPKSAVIIGDEEDLQEDQAPLYAGTVRPPDSRRRQLEGTRFVFTSAQNNTAVHRPFWDALQKFCMLKSATLCVAKVSYNKNGWANHNGADGTKQDSDLWYDPLIADYVLDEQVKIADGLIFCGELDILPTMQNPLTGLDNYSGPNSAIIPHVKLHMQSYATMKHEDAKLLYTTGTVTLRNYIERRAGQLASFNHVYSALYVEVDKDGEWFVSQLVADDDGCFYLRDEHFSAKESRPAANILVNLGDIHAEKTDPVALRGAFDMLQVLQPESVFVHDLLDFRTMNHHNKKDPYFLAEMQAAGNTVEGDMFKAVTFLNSLHQITPSSTIYVIRSNHDTAYKKWLSEGSFSEDPANKRYWHEGNAKLHSEIEKGNAGFDIFKWAIQYAASKMRVSLSRIEFIQEDESLVIHGIEYGMHGHLGPNGARGNPKAFRQIGRRANTGHTHSAGIIDGVWTAGVLASLDMGYNKGPSSWSQSHILTYPNGKRCIVTQRGSKWRA